MYHDEEVELTLDEKHALASLPRTLAPSDMLESRVVRALRQEGHLGTKSRSRGGVSLALRIAAAIALFAGGVATGRYVLSTGTPQRTAAVPAPAGISTTRAAEPQKSTAQPARTETVVAEREMWM